MNILHIYENFEIRSFASPGGIFPLTDGQTDRWTDRQNDRQTESLTQLVIWIGFIKMSVTLPITKILVKLKNVLQWNTYRNMLPCI